jgi:hypothetical protein
LHSDFGDKSRHYVYPCQRFSSGNTLEDYNPPRISKTMVPSESLSQYLSNEYQCYGVSIET